jgi:molecular chaperone GrpE (heat shock protein)
MKIGRKTTQPGVGEDLARDISGMAKSLPAIHHAVEEVAEDNMAMLQAIKRASEGQDALRAAVVQEIAQLRSDLTGELISNTLRNVCSELSPVLNAMESMLAEADFADSSAMRLHMESLAMTLDAALRRMGIERIPVTVGSDLFDSQIHDCVKVCTPPDSPLPDAESRVIVWVQEWGYNVGGRLAKPAKVWVQKLETREFQSEKESTS